MTASIIAINDLTLPEASTLRQALTVIDRNALGIAFALGVDGRLAGVATDGDIRRALLRGVSLDEPVAAVLKRDCVSLPASAAPETILSAFSDRVSCIPLLDDGGRPVDFATRHRHHRIPVMEPSLRGNELAYVADCLNSNWISSQGKYVTQFEGMFSDYHGGGHALAVSNGTVALHLALVALNIGPGDEVIVPDLTFAASANAVLYTGATPVLVDVDEKTWTLDPEKTERAVTSKTKAIMPVHLYGHPCDMDPLLALAKRRGIKIVEDCAESLGATYRGRPTGILGEAGCFSFFGNKMITTGEGGMVLFRDRGVYERARRLRDHGMDPAKRYWHTEIGYNYRLTNMQAAVGVAQMEQAGRFLELKRKIAKTYDELLRGLPGIVIPPSADWAKSSYWLYTVQLEASTGIQRDELMLKLLHNGVETRPVFYPLHIMPPYARFAGSEKFPVSEKLSTGGISLPSAVNLTEEDARSVAGAIRGILGTRSLYNAAQKAG